ncbi:MAG: flagellar basal-body MS-ring/collar protein FliF [Rhodothermales bacterium]
MNPFFQNVQAFLRRLSPGQKLSLGLVVVGGVGIIGAIAFWAGQPNYALLFGNLEPGDANQVVEALQADGVKYEIKNNGTAVYVPRDDVYELRLRFAGDGLVSDGPLGYELFDRGTLGMTDFMQKLNLKRALEGELSRTITNVRQVDVARVHLVMPERSPFRETQVEPTASVVLKLAGSSRLTSEQIDGITQLVAGAVEGLAPADVTVLDTRGNMLSNPNQGDADAISSSTQLEYQRSVEKHLTDKGQSMLDTIVGPGNAIVRVSANIDFSRRVSESNVIDPESATVIAEESMDQNTGEDAANSSIRNYELSRTVERSESATGQISDLTVSVILNDRRFVITNAAEEGDDAENQAQDEVAYTEADLAEIEDLVKNSVGFQPARGDRFAIHQTSFDTSIDQQIANDMLSQERDRQMQLYLRFGLMAIALLAALWLLRSATKKVHIEGDDRIYLGRPLEARSLGRGPQQDRANQLEAHGAAEEEEDDIVMVDDFFTSKLSKEAKARLKAKHLMYEEIKEAVNDNPDNTADLLRNWMLEDNVPG